MVLRCLLSSTKDMKSVGGLGPNVNGNDDGGDDASCHLPFLATSSSSSDKAQYSSVPVNLHGRLAPSRRHSLTQFTFAKAALD